MQVISSIGLMSDKLTMLLASFYKNISGFAKLLSTKDKVWIVPLLYGTSHIIYHGTNYTIQYARCIWRAPSASRSTHNFPFGYFRSFVETKAALAKQCRHSRRLVWCQINRRCYLHHLQSHVWLCKASEHEGQIVGCATTVWNHSCYILKIVLIYPN